MNKERGAGFLADFMHGWRTIGREGKLEYAFLVAISLGVGAVCFYILWFAYIVPYWRLMQRSFGY